MTKTAAAEKETDNISIHIPRVGDDAEIGGDLGGGEDFNPHPPCGG